MRRQIAIWALLLGVGLVTACSSSGQSVKQWSSAPAMVIDPNKQYSASIRTNLGDLQVDLLAKDTPNTVNNFVFLARNGFYDGSKFHRVINEFMVQTGDPTGSGRGGPGYQIVDEPVIGSYDRGVLAMANTGRPNTAGSQFFIVQGASVTLPKTYTIFGKVTEGMDVVDKIAAVPVAAAPTGELSVPQQEVRIEKVTINER